MKKDSVYMGTNVKPWMAHKKIKYITFSVTDDCNLACKYCYFVHKSNHNIMTIDIAKDAIELILKNDDFLEYDGVVWDFIGGEPTLEIKLIDQICDYLLLRMYELNHKWLYCFRFLIGTNGLLYSSEEVQKLIRKHKINLQVSITIDGNKEKHDLSRIRKDGSGSYNQVVSQLPLWQEQQHSISTKATFSHEDLPYLKDSIINLWNLGIKNIMANIVFENVWENDDPQIFKTQLIELADYIVENNLWYDYSVRFFDYRIGMPVTEDQKKHNFCGTGKMLAISTDGKFFPCVRFMDSAFNKHVGLTIGNVSEGLDDNRVRAFKAVDANTISSQNCLDCEIGSGCFWCSGFNYDDSICGTIFERKTYICKMHKANVEACDYLWRKYEETTGNISPRRIHRLRNAAQNQKWLYIISQQENIPFCNFSKLNLQNKTNTVDNDYLRKAIAYCENNGYNPIFIGNFPLEYKKLGYVITDNFNDDQMGFDTCIYIPHEQIQNSLKLTVSNVILSETLDTLDFVIDDINVLLLNPNIKNINLTIRDVIKINETELKKYQNILCQLIDIFLGKWIKGCFVELNILTHILHFKEQRICRAGTSHITLAPDGKFYPCPAFYYDEERDWSIGGLEEGLNNIFYELCNPTKSKICNKCDANHCSKCIFLCKKQTNEFCVPSKELCLKSNIEREASRVFCEKLQKNKVLINLQNLIKYPLEILDPLLR